ncbi:MAG: ABC transporter permease [Trueperaceae bacterium]|nr:MAG: ABC transporter permease [Trueperaceae bacterium]
MEISKVLRLNSVRFGLLILVVFPLLWSYAPGIFKVYGFYLVSGFQVPALSLLSSMEFLLPLLVAIVSSELLGMEFTHGTLPTILLRPVGRSQWLLAKVLIVALFPFLILLFFLAVSMVAGLPYGYEAFVGGTGLGATGLLGDGLLAPGGAFRELLRAYGMAAFSLVPVSLLAILFTVVLKSSAGGALATMSVLVVMQLLVVFPWLEPYLLTTQLSAYITPDARMGWVVTLVALYCTAFAAVSVVLFERKDF